MSEIGLKKGIIINFIAKYSNIIIQLIITAILARLLTSKEYGIVSVVTVFITFFSMLGDMGIGPAIIQYKDLKEEDISSIFIFTMFVSISLSIIFFIFSYVISYIYKNNIYNSLGHLLCFAIIFNVLSIVPNGILLKNKQFKIIGISNVSSGLISGCITIILALLGFSYYSLVLNSIMYAMLNFSILFHFSDIRLKLKSFSLEPIKKISHFSIYQFLFNFINYFSRNSDNLLIGKYLGMSPLGFYDKAYRLMLYPVQNLTFVITPVLQPVLSDYQHDKDVILNQYKKIVRLLALIGAFISVFCFFSSKEIIMILFGKDWAGSIGSFKYLSTTIVIQMVLSSSGAIFQATNNARLLFISGLSGALIMISSIITGVLLGSIEYVSLALVIAFILNFFQCFYFLIIRVFNKSLFSFLKEFTSTVIIIALMSITYIFIPFNNTNSIINFILKFITGIISYVVCLVITREYKFIFKILFKKNYN